MIFLYILNTFDDIEANDLGYVFIEIARSNRSNIILKTHTGRSIYFHHMQFFWKIYHLANRLISNFTDQLRRILVCINRTSLCL